MPWHEISVLFFFIGSFVAAVIFGVVWDIQRIKAQNKAIKKLQQFYEIASEFFYHHMGDKL